MGLEGFLEGQPDTKGSGKEALPVVVAGSPLDLMLKFYMGLRNDTDVANDLNELLRKPMINYFNYKMVERKIIQHYQGISITPPNIASFWKLVQTRKLDYDKKFAGLYIGMLISAFREKDPDTPIVFDGDIELNNFASDGKNITNIQINGSIIGDNCFFSMGSGIKIASDIKISGDIMGGYCFESLGSSGGSVSNIYIGGNVQGSSCFLRMGTNQGNVSNVFIGGNVQGDKCFYRAGAQNGDVSDFTIVGKILGKEIFNEAGYDRGRLSNIKIGNVLFEKPTYQQLEEAIYGPR